MTKDQPAEFDSKTFLRSLSHRPGVYCMLNAKGKVIYVGSSNFIAGDETKSFALVVEYDEQQLSSRCHST